MYNYLIIFCFTLFYTSVFYPRKFIWNFGRSNPAYSYKEHKEAIENLNLRLAEYGQPELGRMRDYWNSTEADAKRAHILVFTNAPFKSYTKGTEKFAERFVRAVHKF